MFWKRNGSTILTVAGAAGVVGTTVLAIKATPKAMSLLEEAKHEKGDDLTKKEVIVIAGPTYIPAVITGVATIACIFGANVLNKHQQASIASAYALLDNTYKEYRKKVNELYGEDADNHIKKELAKDNYNVNNIVRTNQKELFYDDFSKRYFESTMEEVLMAEANLNKQIAVSTGAYLNEFYEFLGISTMKSGQELGWSNGILESMYWTNWVDFDHSEVVMDDGSKCVIITMRQEPVIDFAYY